LLHDRNSNVPPANAIVIRVGLHVGDVVHEGDDVYGDAVNVASRIEPIAEPGGVCLSERVFLDVRNKVDCRMASVGKRELKNVGEPMEIYRLLLPWTKEPLQSVRSVERRRVAVLPLVNIGGIPADEYFADGLTEELISALSGIRGLRVISRTSVMRYKGTGKAVPEIARELNVGTVVEGSVRKSGERVRISVQLIDATQDEHLWAGQYDRELDRAVRINPHVVEQQRSPDARSRDHTAARDQRGGRAAAPAGIVVHELGRRVHLAVRPDRPVAVVEVEVGHHLGQVDVGGEVAVDGANVAPVGGGVGAGANG